LTTRDGDDDGSSVCGDTVVVLVDVVERAGAKDDGARRRGTKRRADSTAGRVWKRDSDARPERAARRRRRRSGGDAVIDR
jgi:hypothetical protein